MSVDEIISFTDYPGIQASFLRRDLLLAVGGFEHSCHTNTLLHYMLEAAKIGARCRRVQTIWGNYRQHSHASYLSYVELNKGIIYARLRAQACRKNEERYRAFLTPTQVRSLRRAAYEYELRFRIGQRHQIIRSLPTMAKCFWLGGRLPWVVDQYGVLAKGALARLAGVKKKKSLRQGINTRWYLATHEGTNSPGSQ